MLIELILSIPARLSDLLVVLTSLMRPLVMALHEGQELVGLGLRTLEYWVDRCQPPSPFPPPPPPSTPLVVLQLYDCLFCFCSWARLLFFSLRACQCLAVLKGCHVAICCGHSTLLGMQRKLHLC